MSQPVLQVLIASTRPGRVGPAVAAWFVDLAREHGAFEVDLVDLAELDLPFMDEPNHPRLRAYTHDHTKAWSERVDRADAFVFVMPEYNYSYTAPLKNAMDYLHEEWKHKPISFVSYGGISAGLRAVQAIKQVTSTLSMTSTQAAVPIPFVASHLDDEGRFQGTDIMRDGARATLEELLRLHGALSTLR